MVKDFGDLEVYRRSVDLARRIYLLTRKFPKDEIYGMRDQIRRAAASVGANIAEGFGRYHYKDKLVFFYNARGSLYETRHFLELAFVVGYILESEKLELDKEISVLSVKLNNFIAVIGKGTGGNNE